jgi:hypothetical protein
MKVVRLLSRVALLSLMAAAFAVLTRLYGDSVRPVLPDQQWRTERAHRPSAPEVSRFPEVIGEGLIVAIYAVLGRIVFRLRLSPASRGAGDLLLLRFQQERRTVNSGTPWKKVRGIRQRVLHSRSIHGLMHFGAHFLAEARPNGPGRRRLR